MPPDAWLRTSLGIQPEAWTKEGDGVLFRIGVSFRIPRNCSTSTWILSPSSRIGIECIPGEYRPHSVCRRRGRGDLRRERECCRRRATTAVTTSRSGCARKSTLARLAAQRRKSPPQSISSNTPVSRFFQTQSHLKYLPFIARSTPLGSTWTTDNALAS